MYFDAVLDTDLRPLFNGTPAQTKTWLKDNRGFYSATVHVGETGRMMSVPDYLEGKM